MSTQPDNPLRTDAPLADNPAASLEQLRNLQLPDPIGLWPPAPGWWLLAILIIGLIGWFGWRLITQLRRNRYRRYALAELQSLKELQGLERNEPQHNLQQLNQLLRRTALAAYPNHSVASLSGQKWLDFLYRSSRLDCFQQPLGHSLIDGPYRPDCAVNIDALTALTQQWIKRHRRTFTPDTAEHSKGSSC